MSEDAARLSSLAVLGGTLHGNVYRLSRDPEEITIGSDPSCRFRLESPQVAPLHARIVADETGAAVFDTQSPQGVYLNFKKVEGRAVLNDGDMLRLGPPQDRSTVMIQLEFGGELLESPPAPALAPAAVPPGAPETPFATANPDTPFAIGRDEDLDAALIADLQSSDDAFVVAEDEPAARAPSLPATGPSRALPMDEVVAADEFFVAAEPEAVAADPAPAAPTPPAAPRASVESSPSAFGMSEGDFALPSFDPNWGAKPTPPVPPAAPDEFFVSENASPAPASASGADEFFVTDVPAVPAFASPAPKPPAPASADDGFALATDDQPLSFDAAPPAAPASAGSPAAPPRATVAPTPSAGQPPPAVATIPVKPRAEAGAAGSPAATARPAATRPARRPGPSEEGASAPRPRAAAARPRPSAPSPLGRYAAMGGGALALVALLGFVATRFLGGGAKITAVEPPRAKVGQIVTLVGGPFASDPTANEVLFDDKPGAVLEGDGNRLKVQVPDLATPPGQDVKVGLRVRLGGKDSRTFEMTVFGGPTVVGISPDVAMPGEVVVLAGSGWGASPVVHFGESPAEVLQASSTSIRVRVPDLSGGPGMAAPVVVKDGPAESSPAPFYVGRIPLLLSAEPASVVPGDLITISGRGFRREAAQNTVLIGGTRALVTSAIDSQLSVVAPFSALGTPGGLSLRVAGSETEAQAPLTVLPSSDTVDFRFAAQPFDAAGSRDHVVLATGLGPAFVLAAAGGKSAAERAYEVQKRLNDAGTALKASRDVDIELRNPEQAPALALTGRSDVLLEVTEEDVAAYNEDWTGLRGRGGPVSRVRLGQWWAAVAKDLALMLVRGAKPANAPGLAPEARILNDVSQAAQRSGRFGVPWSAVEGLRPAQRDAVRLLAFRVPPSVTGPGGGTGAAPSAALKLEGSWTGSEVESGQRRYISATFSGGTGSIDINAAVTMSMPLLTLEARRNEARFSLQFRGGTRHYIGKWDGQTLSGSISNDPAGREVVATFELRPR
jgi:FHA domain/IPT/TIG domain